MSRERVYASIAEHGPSTAGELAERLSLHWSTIYHHLRRLAIEGRLVEYGRNPLTYALAEQEPPLSALAARVARRWLRARSAGVPLTLDRSRAACAGMDTEQFFARGGAWPSKRVCAVCPVVVACLDFALRTGEEYGVFGGCTSGERRRIRDNVTVTTR